MENDHKAGRDEFVRQKGVEEDCWMERGEVGRQQGWKMTAGRAGVKIYH